MTKIVGAIGQVLLVREVRVESEIDEGVILAVAMAIEGPHRAMPADSLYSLKDVRRVQWDMLSSKRKARRLAQAKAALLQAHHRFPDPEQEGGFRPVGLEEE